MFVVLAGLGFRSVCKRLAIPAQAALAVAVVLAAVFGTINMQDESSNDTVGRFGRVLLSTLPPVNEKKKKKKNERK